ncbi:hypothetical protein IQ244_13665 [Nostoc sp. LEGE 06077]|nr:hypothetical protein [Nostoc sp. LEGE 06077]MBE9207552.1 hypothetical protein [Nostoc sp. LEGE 06077]
MGNYAQLRSPYSLDTVLWFGQNLTTHHSSQSSLWNIYDTEYLAIT